MTLEPGRDLPHFRLVGRIGEGGPGVVWNSRDTSLGREVAIEVLRAAFASYRDGRRNVRIASTEDGALRRLTDDDAIDHQPRFSPHGRYVYSSSDRAGAGGVPNLWRVRFAPGAGRVSPERVTLGEGTGVAPHLAADGAVRVLEGY